ncbi:hypothetical protein HHI36_017306 [Cryptolaemus montrouzieri]|uniref:Uncharacterized protein n=1 Tax=Cryptolaemus montrouzieri TaxID=559131 RepID=A0ABD2NM61_9CUCU
MSNIFATSLSNLVNRLGRSIALVCGDFDCKTIDWNPSGFGHYETNNTLYYAMRTDITHCSAPLVREDANHPALEFVINIEAIKYIRENIRFINFKRAEYTIMNSVPWSDILSRGSLDDNLTTLYAILNETIQKNIPLITKNGKLPLYFSI